MRGKALDNAYYWWDVLVIIGLDTTALFREELGMSSFYSESLREIAQSSMEPYSSLCSELGVRQVERFLDAVSAKLGRPVRDSVAAWKAAVYPGHALAMRYFVWEDLLKTLRRDYWDGDSGDRSAPLGENEHASIRITVRDFLAHSRNVRDEIGKFEEDLVSEWDRWLCSQIDFAATITMCEMVLNRCSGELWCELGQKLSSEDLRALTDWSREVASREGHPLRYIRIPVRQS